MAAASLGGEQQMLADRPRALMTNPTADDPGRRTEGLAPLIVAEIWRVIGQIRDTGITLIVDRNYCRVLAHTDRAVVMEKGRAS